ncbi:MAG: EpsI family protein [Candidatus Brocadiales bacterium]|nr:EpsI family protein [Candidatus Brocadiales bacterium]
MKMDKKTVIVIILLTISIAVSYVVPETKYKGTNFITNLDIPESFNKWKSRDVTESLDINTEESKFNFINDARAINYYNDIGKNLLFIVLDAGNFHHPKVCFTAAGYELKELPDTILKLGERNFQAHTLFTTKGKDTFLSLYWIIIDQKIVHKWVEQKVKQLFFSMLNKDRVGLMVRIDIPTTPSTIPEAQILAEKFLQEISQTLPENEANYIFGTL